MSDSFATTLRALDCPARTDLDVDRVPRAATPASRVATARTAVAFVVGGTAGREAARHGNGGRTNVLPTALTSVDTISADMTVNDTPDAQYRLRGRPQGCPV